MMNIANNARWIAVGVLVIIIQLHCWSCFQLSSGPYPVYLASPQRTGEINRPVSCNNVSVFSLNFKYLLDCKIFVVVVIYNIRIFGYNA